MSETSYRNATAVASTIKPVSQLQSVPEPESNPQQLDKFTMGSQTIFSKEFGQQTGTGSHQD